MSFTQHYTKIDARNTKQNTCWFISDCITPTGLLDGRRRIESAVLRASNDISGNRASQARLSDDGWCSGQLATDIFDPYIEVDFGRDLLFTSIATQGFDPSFVESLIFVPERYIQRYRIEIAGEDDDLQYVIPLANNSQPQPAVSSYSCTCFSVVYWFHCILCVCTDIPTGTK